jgi:hypothetical protein
MTRVRVDWKPGEWHKFFSLMDRLKSDPSAPKEKAALVRAVNAQMERPRQMNTSSDCSGPWKKYEEYKSKGKVIVGRGHVLNGAPQQQPGAVVASNDTSAIRPSAANPYPHLANPPSASAPIIRITEEVEIDGLPPPTFWEMLVEVAIDKGGEALGGILVHESVLNSVRTLRTMILRGEQAEVDARNADTTALDWSPKDRGPRILIVGLLDSQEKQTKQKFIGRANIKCCPTNAKHQLRHMLKPVEENGPEAIISVTKFMSHSAEQVILSKTRADKSPRYIRHGGGLTGLWDKVETICQGWTRRELANNPRAGSMSAGHAERHDDMAAD